MGTAGRAPVITLTATMVALAVSPAVASTVSSATGTVLPGCGWTTSAAPRPPGSSILYGVGALGDDDVWAVGSSGPLTAPDTLAEHWDGSAWTIVKTPSPRRHLDDGNVLAAVSGSRPDDIWAVGDHIKRGGIQSSPLLLHYDGSRWRTVPAPAGRFVQATLTGVVAISADDAWAVGTRYRGSPPQQAPMMLHWDGSTWQLVRVPNPPSTRGDETGGIAATGPDDVWAVGQSDDRNTLALHFDGTRWRIVRTPNPPGDARDSLLGVTALAADDVWAAGIGGLPTASLVEHWDGSSWSIVRTPNREKFDELAGITAATDGRLWAVGLFQPPAGTYQTLAMEYDGSSWAMTRSPNQGGGDQLEAVSAVGSDVWAVGVTAPGPDQAGSALILHHC